MKFKLIAGIFIILLPFISNAQNTSYHRTHRHHHISKKVKAPDWAKAKNYNMDAHVYFPDYHSFYDPNRGGYVFLENGKWSFTPTVPPYMSNADLSKARVQILKGLSLDLHPETNYPKYIKLYPAVEGSNGNDVLTPTPIPIPGNQ